MLTNMPTNEIKDTVQKLDPLHKVLPTEFLFENLSRHEDNEILQAPLTRDPKKCSPNTSTTPSSMLEEMWPELKGETPPAAAASRRT